MTNHRPLGNSSDRVRILAAAMAVACALLISACGGTIDEPHGYTIVDLGAVGDDWLSIAYDSNRRGEAVCTSQGQGGIVRTFTWSRQSGQVVLPGLPDSKYMQGVAIDDEGTVAGSASVPGHWWSVPVAWRHGSLELLPLPAGHYGGRVHDVSPKGVFVGEAYSETGQQALVIENGVARVIPGTPDLHPTSANAINDQGLAVGRGSSGDQFIVWGYVADLSGGDMTVLGRGTLPRAVSNKGHVVGGMGIGNPQPFLWTKADGLIQLPLPANTDTGFATGVNAAGRVVGSASWLNDEGEQVAAGGFLYDGEKVVPLQDYLEPESGWSRLRPSAIGDDGIIVGDGWHDGKDRAFMMIPKR